MPPLKYRAAVLLAVTSTLACRGGGGSGRTGTDSEPDGSSSSGATSSTTSASGTASGTGTVSDSSTSSGTGGTAGTGTDGTGTSSSGGASCPSMVFSGDFVGEPVELAGYTEVSGNVGLRALQASDLTGMECLDTIGGILGVSEMPNLVSFDGLGPVQSVDSLVITLNPELVDISALSSLRQVEARLRIVNNPQLTSMEPLDAIEGTITDVEIWDNTTLSAVSLAGVETVENDISVQRNDVVNHLGFDQLGNAGSLQISANTALQSLDGLETVTGVEFYVRVFENPALTDVSALLGAKLVAVASEIGIHDNAQLPQCDAVALADSLKPVGWAGTEDLTNNLGTCP